MKNRHLKSLSLKPGIHTICIRSSNIPKYIPTRLTRCVKNKHFTQEIDTKVREYCTIINPNYYRGKIETLGDFNSAMDSLKGEIGLESFKLTRVDFSIDNFEPQSYNKYLKINKWVVLILAMKHDAKSLYQSINSLTFEKLTLRMDSEYIQVEYYNKNIESNGQSPVHARLELRSKRLLKTGHEVEDELSLWCDRLKALPRRSKILQDKCNEILISIWEEESASGEVLSKAEFIRKYQVNIFTDQQLIDLCLLLGSTEKYAREIKTKMRIETYKESDLVEFIEMIVEELINFTVNDQKR